MLSAVLLTAAVAVTAATAFADDVPDEYLGTYRFSGGGAQRDALSQEIDRVADQFGFLSRGIARGRMHSEIRAESKIALERRGGQIVLQLDERRPVPCDGSWHPAEGANEEVGTGRCQFTNGRLRYDERYDEGRVFHTFTPISEGQGLRMGVTVRHPSLPDILRYRLSYRRR